MLKDDQLYRDLMILKGLLSTLCDWTHLNVLLIIHSNHEKSQDEIEKDIALLVYLKDQEILGHLQTSIVYLQKPLKQDQCSYIDETLSSIMMASIKGTLSQ